MKNLLLKSQKSILLLILLVVSSISRGQSTQTYTSNGSFITPAGVTTVKAEAYGAGGAGGLGGGANKQGGGGGGGGGYSVINTATVTPGATYSITVGVGGTANANTASGNGSATTATFTSTSINANGAAGGRRYSGGGNGGNGGNGNTYKGGTGGTGTALGSGGGGGAAGTTSIGGNGSVTAGGTSGGGSAGIGANGSTANIFVGNTGNNYGAGGSGGTKGSYGGDGADGYMIITYTCPTYGLTSVTSPNTCSTGNATITLNSTATGLPVGDYIVTYSASGSTTISSDTYSMTVTTAGIGTIICPSVNAGTTIITINKIESSYCSTNFISGGTNNTVTITSALPSITLGSQPSICSGVSTSSISYSGVTNGANEYSIAWSAAGIAAGMTNVGWTALSGGIIPLTGLTNTAGTYPMTITVRNSTTGCSNVIVSPSIVCGTGNEGNTVSLTTTNGTFTSVDFSSYGTPNGTCGSFTTGACHASNSVSLVSASAIGQTSFSIAASNGIFGDPCGGTAKRLYIQATSSSFNLVVNSSSTINLSSGAGTNNQTTCTNTAISTITFTTVAATGATFSGLPAGVTGNWASNVVTISGIPTVSGTFPYTVTLTGGCGTPVTASGTITVTLTNTITLTSAVGTNNQAVCFGTAITNITYTTTNATGATFSGLPLGISGSLVSNVITISGTSLSSGTFPYTVTLSGGCGSSTATGTITINTNNTITLSSGAGTNNQTRCINTTMSSITFTTTSATGASFLGLPSGVTGNWAANVVTISGTPTVSGTFLYSVILTGGCGVVPVTASGTITVNPNNTITLSSGAGTNNQTKCINTAITNITFNTTGATGATFSGLPTGVNGTFASSTVTISGTPSVSGTFNYTVTLTGGCGTTTATGTITVTPNKTITLSSGAGTNNQTTCINTLMSNITFNTPNATGATFSGLPSGVTGNWSANVVTINGTPTVSGTFNYTITVTGGCGPLTTATGTITVTANNTITLSSAASTNNQTKCINTAITTITYSTVRATGATFSGLPSGINGNWASNVATISGTPTVSGIFNYTVTLTGGCGTTTATGSITVNPNNTITLSSGAGTNNTNVCINTSMAAITFNTVSATGSTFSGLPTGVTGNWASNVVTLSGTPTVAGTFNYTISSTGGCGPTATATGTIIVNTIPTVTGTTPGSRTGAGTVLLGATASLGTLNWYATATGGSSLGTGTSFTTPFIATTTTFYVEAINGSCTSTTRTPVLATVNYTEIDIQGNATSIVSGDTTPTTADWTDFGSTNSTRTFTIRNIGGALLTVGAITISGANASDFTVTTAPASAVAIGSSTTFIITFAPSAIGIRNATLSIVNNDLDENPYIFDIRGTGVEQEIDIQGNAVSIVNGDSTPSLSDWTDFSNVAGTRTFTILNTGNIALTIGAITIGGINPGDFSITTPPAAIVDANSSTTFVVTFAPTAINARKATISIVNNDSNENPYNFAIQGFGVIPEIDVQGNAVSIPDSTVPAPTTANWTDFSSTNGTRTFTIFNNGNLALTVGAITFSGTNASEFTVTTLPSSTVAAFSSTTFTVTFQPTAVGTRTANIKIVNNDSDENPYDFRIQGTGTPREIDVQGLGLSIASGDMITSISDGTDFGPADVNLATVTRTFTIKNTGSLPLTISNPTISGANAAEFSITANPSTLLILAGSSVNFSVTFNPSAVFTRVAKITIVNNDSDENPYTFAIQGTGLLDNDGDGIENNTDEDDDNDGILDSIECGTCISNPFVNGSFETPTIGASTYAILPTTSVPGWETSAENFIEIWSSGFNGVPAAAGNQFAELNANIAGTLYQSFCLNGAGGTINWAIKHRGRGGVDQAFVKFGNTLANALSSTPIVTMVDGTSSWGSYSGTYTIPAGQTNIVLTFQAGYTGSGDASVGNFIDDVQIIINQNCIDSDGDGVADILDVDSDNDGIPDIEEAGFKQYSNNTATMDKTNPANWKDVNKNGVNDYIDAMIANGTYFIPDTDGDGVPNHLDLDSDNDSVFDVDEAGLLNGDGDINGDGKGDGLDTEGDGLLNLYDNSPAFGSAFRPYAQDSDLNGIADYLQLDANDDGVNDIQTGLYGSFDANGDGRIDGSGDIDHDGITDTFDTNTAVKGSPRDLNRKLYLDFDGRNDYAEDTALLGGLSNATLMAWIDLNSSFSATGFVVGQDKFHIRVTSSRVLEAVVNGTTLSFPTPLNKSQWCHVAATYGGGNLTLFLNGKSVATVALSGAIGADPSKLSLGRHPVLANSFFKGKIDEVRVFNVALTPNQLERMVYQEIQNNASQVRGAIVPKDIGALPFANLLKYYRMDTYKDDIVDNLTTPSVDTGTGMKLYNHKVINYQQAPMPFTTVRAGTFATAVNDVTKDIRGLDVLDFDYSIIQVKHNITETANSTDLALFIDPAVTVSMTNDTKLQNDWYLKLDGKIDLVGKSQLVQTTNSDLDVTSAGSIERDQQGQTNKFNYNYWSSPVSSINNTTINHGFTVAGVMKDGTNPNSIQNLLWTPGINGSPTTPAMTLSSYWIFKFQNSSNAYANWASVGQNGLLAPGQGYTLKGNGSIAENQNYTFVGKPNSGVITSTVGAGNLNLCGNPYPSAIDANKFIDDNASSLKGTLYIWEHYSTNNSHNTIQYQGGYATYTKTGGTAPVAPAGISGLGSSSKTPKRFIPVGQGFFVTGSATGGTINFNNGQRLFVKEDDTANSYSMFKNNNNTVSANPETNNANDTFEEDQFMKLRVGYNSTDNLHRQTLIGFMNENATSGYDNGYDGVSIEALTNDMYFINGTDKLNISGEGFFDVNAIYPIGVKNATSGNVTFVVDGKENFDDDQEIFIHDNVTNTYNSIKSQNYEVNLPAGTYENRFTLRFTDGETLGTTDNDANHGIGVTHSQSNNMINIKNPLQQVTVKSVALFNLLGQQVSEWKVDNQDQANIQLQVANVSTATYIVKVMTDGGNVTKKILVKK